MGGRGTPVSQTRVVQCGHESGAGSSDAVGWHASWSAGQLDSSALHAVVDLTALHPCAGYGRQHAAICINERRTRGSVQVTHALLTKPFQLTRAASSFSASRSPWAMASRASPAFCSAQVGAGSDKGISSHHNQLLPDARAMASRVSPAFCGKSKGKQTGLGACTWNRCSRQQAG